MTISGIEKTQRRPTKKAAPITPNILSDMIKHLNVKDYNQLAFRTIFIVAFFLLLRKSNLVYTPGTGRNYLKRSDFKKTKHGYLVLVDWSKTNQKGEIHPMPLVRIPGSELCPVKALDNYFRVRRGPHKGAAFTDKNGNPFTYYQYSKCIKRCIADCNLNPNAFSSHSFRRGSSSFMHTCNISDLLIRYAGGWGSDCFKEYIDFSLHTKLQACLAVKTAILSLKL